MPEVLEMTVPHKTGSVAMKRLVDSILSADAAPSSVWVCMVKFSHWRTISERMKGQARRGSAST